MTAITAQAAAAAADLPVPCGTLVCMLAVPPMHGVDPPFAAMNSRSAWKHQCEQESGGGYITVEILAVQLGVL